MVLGCLLDWPAVRPCRLAVCRTSTINRWTSRLRPEGHTCSFGGSRPVRSATSFTCSTRYAAVDAVRAAATGSAARTAAQRLLAGWGIVLGLIGLVAVWRGLGDDRPAYVGIRALEFSLGEYNLRGALALIAIALAMLAAAKRGWRTVALVAAVVAVAAAAAIYLQVGRTAVWLGGTNTTAAVFVCAAVVSLATEFRIGRVEGA